MKQVKIKSPGTVANLVCGFDILGMALSEPYDVMELTLLNEPKVIIHNKDNFNLPTDPEKNVAGVVLSVPSRFRCPKSNGCKFASSRF